MGSPPHHWQVCDRNIYQRGNIVGTKSSQIRLLSYPRGWMHAALCYWANSGEAHTRISNGTIIGYNMKSSCWGCQTHIRGVQMVWYQPCRSPVGLCYHTVSAEVDPETIQACALVLQAFPHGTSGMSLWAPRSSPDIGFTVTTWSENHLAWTSFGPRTHRYCSS